ncbi:ABC transporter permease [Olivibacter sp. SDN3]|uniref:ABC transporter permease n=1 Tax=Olivibacter sp. SDN3 TaxID=2764720 RepID=UPI0016514278|nr:ABC transporter permease [Olivibacter sp. SDN3]QNL51883.1 ABC transporter permease [Olivibacter sp. SDN3]
MFKNYFTIAWRNLVRNKAYTVINIFGLALGMTITILIGLWVWDELSFNKGFKDHERIVKVLHNSSDGLHINTVGSISIPAAIELKSKYAADFEHIALYRYGRATMSTKNSDENANSFGFYAEPGFTDILSLQLVKGSVDSFADPSSILISERLATILFDKTDPIGQVIKINNESSATVTGVYQNFAPNTDFTEQQFILPWNSLVASRTWVKDAYKQWNNNSFFILAKIAKNADLEQVSGKVKNLLVGKPDRNDQPEIILQPATEWHLYNEFRNGKNVGGNIQFVWMFGLIGLFVCILACINFMNLSTAQSQKRAAEVGIRKTVGSSKAYLVMQFLSESILIAILASVLAIILVWLALPWFNTLSSKEMLLPTHAPIFWLAIGLFALFTGILSGSYPALYLSSFKPIKVLKGAFNVGRFSEISRRLLVVFQFTVSLSLIVGTVIIFRQIQHVKNRPLGYEQQGLISIDINTPDLKKPGIYAVLRNELINSGYLENMAEASNTATYIGNHFSGFDWPGKQPDINQSIGVCYVTHDFGSTLKWQFKDGRDFSRDFPTDTNAIILNEAAVRYMSLEHPIGETIKYEDVPYKVIGVIKNVLMESPFEEVSPNVFMLSYTELDAITIKIKSTVNTANALAAIESIFKKYNPASPFEYSFVDTDYAEKFSFEQKIGSLARLFASFAIFISCLGIFGLSAFMAEQRTKEIGVRKVLGATVLSLWVLLSKNFLLLVLVSFSLAIPLSWYIMNHWLEGYDYHTGISLWVYLSTAIGVIMLTLVTVSFQTIKAALVNPVKSLRSE